MYSIRKHIVLAVCLAGLAGSAFALPADFFDKLNVDARPMENKIRDDARRPGQVMELLGVEEGMTVVDIGAGDGWWSWALSAAVGPSGKVIAQGVRGDGGALTSLGNVEIVGSLDDLDADSVDAAVTALNIHHMNDQRAGAYFQGILRILKPGATAVVIDHVGVAGMDSGQQHRVEPSVARRWIEGAGLQIVEESDLLRTNGDDHTLDVRDPMLGRNTDRFLYVVRKPR